MITKAALFLLIVTVASIMSVQAVPYGHLAAKICPTIACDGKEAF